MSRTMLVPDYACRIMLDLGVLHSGRFASAYHATFGEYPSQTAERAVARPSCPQTASQAGVEHASAIVRLEEGA